MKEEEESGLASPGHEIDSVKPDSLETKSDSIKKEKEQIIKAINEFNPNSSPEKHLSSNITSDKSTYSLTKTTKTTTTTTTTKSIPRTINSNDISKLKEDRFDQKYSDKCTFDNKNDLLANNASKKIDDKREIEIPIEDNSKDIFRIEPSIKIDSLYKNEKYNNDEEGLAKILSDCVIPSSSSKITTEINFTENASKKRQQKQKLKNEELQNILFRDLGNNNHKNNDNLKSYLQSATSSSFNYYYKTKGEFTEKEEKKSENLNEESLKNNLFKEAPKNLNNSKTLLMYPSAHKFQETSTRSGVQFHPTWDEWKKSTITNAKTTNLNEKIKHSNEANEKVNSNDVNINSTEGNSKKVTTVIEEIYKQKAHAYNKQQETNKKNEREIVLNTNHLLLPKKGIEVKHQVVDGAVGMVETYVPPQPIIINTIDNLKGERQQLDELLKSCKEMSSSIQKSSPKRHYPVYPIDKRPERASSPPKFSTCTLAKEPPIEIKIKEEKKPEEIPILPETPKKIKTIVSKRKDSAPSLTGWRTESDSDTEIQSRLLAKASGSIPIEYISIRRDPKMNEKKTEKNKRSITTGTNTSVERGKKVAATNTDSEELPQYNLHVSLDSIFVKSRREASTSTERIAKDAVTETIVNHKDAQTITDPVKPPSPPSLPKTQPPSQEYMYRSRKSRYTEWESGSNPNEESYRLEFLTQSPRSSSRRKNNFYEKNSNYMSFTEDEADFSSDIENSFIRRGRIQEVRVDDDDKLIFGSAKSSHEHQELNESYNCTNKRYGSYPSLIIQPILATNSSMSENAGTTRRYIKHTTTTNYGSNMNQFQNIGINNEMAGTNSFAAANSNCLNSADALSQSFSQMNAKFNEIFGVKNQQNFPIINNDSQHKTERYYKFSKSSAGNNPNIQQHKIPSFSEVFQRQSSSNIQSQQHSSGQVIDNSSFGNFNTSSRQRYYSNPVSNYNTIGIPNPRVHSPEKAFYNNETNKSNRSNHHYYSTSSASTMQRGFEPISRPIQKQNVTSTSTSSQNKAGNSFTSFEQFSSPILLKRRDSNSKKIRGVNQEEEEVELISSGNIDPERQFRPILEQPNVVEQHSEISEPRRHSYSYEYTEMKNKQSQQPQAFNSSQISS